MRLKCIGCEALARNIYACAAYAPHIIDVEILRLGLHIRPSQLRAELQAHIDAAAGQQYDAIVLAYGLCGQAAAGIIARDIPLVMPRAHDCLTLFLGSRERYRTEFERCSGTYWYTQDYIERGERDSNLLASGAGGTTNREAVYAEYVKKYGEKNAAYLISVLGNWQQQYQRAVYIDTGMGNGTSVETKAMAQAAQFGWTFERMRGDLGLMTRLFAGEWDADFLVVSPGQQIAAAYNDQIIECRADD